MHTGERGARTRVDLITWVQRASLQSLTGRPGTGTGQGLGPRRSVGAIGTRLGPDSLEHVGLDRLQTGRVTSEPSKFR